MKTSYEKVTLQDILDIANSGEMDYETALFFKEIVAELKCMVRVHRLSEQEKRRQRSYEQHIDVLRRLAK